MENRKDYYHSYYLNNKEKIKERKLLLYYNDKKTRALHLLSSHKHEDKINGFECFDLTVDWMVDNILSKPCVHCGETDWHKIGCNRIDNSKGHTIDNVEPCCRRCNCKLASAVKHSHKHKKVFQYTLDGELVKIWNNSYTTRLYGYTPTCVSKCCNNKLKTHKGYKWSFEQM